MSHDYPSPDGDVVPTAGFCAGRRFANANGNTPRTIVGDTGAAPIQVK